MLVLLLLLLAAGCAIGPFLLPTAPPWLPPVGLVAAAIFLGAAGWAFAMLKLWRKPSANQAFVKTGGKRAKVILDGGDFVIPFLHELVPVSLETMKLEVSREQEEALITQDNLRVDVKAEFYIKVEPNQDDILAASRSLGQRAMTPDNLRELVFEKLVSALRTVAATMALGDIHTKRDEFAQNVQNIVKNDLKPNGLTLESVTISRLDQTDPRLLRDENIFDAQGKRKITEITAAQRVRTNELEKEAERQIVDRNVQTRKRVLDLEKDQAAAEATQARDVANVRSERKREQQVYQIEQDRQAQEAAIVNEQMVKERQIAQDQAVEQASLQRDMAIIRQEQEKQQTDIQRKQAIEQARIAQEQAVKEAEITRDQAIILREQEMQQTDIQRDQAVQAAEIGKERAIILEQQKRQTADIERQQAIAVAERQREIAVAEQEAKQAAAQALALQSEAEREKAAQQVKTVEATSQAEREYEVKMTQAKQIIDQDKYKQQTEADVEAYTRIKQAEAEQESAEKQAQARLRLAQAEAESKETIAKGDMAQRMVAVEVDREQVKVEQARVDVQRQELENKQTFERAAIEFETAKLQIEANKEVQTSLAMAIGEFMSRGDYHIYGDPTTMSQMMSQMTRGLGFGTLASGLLEGMPDGAQELVQNVADKLGEAGEAVVDRLAGQKAAAATGGDDPPEAAPESAEAVEPQTDGTAEGE